MKKNGIITLAIVAVMILVTSFVLINTGFINNVFRLKADVYEDDKVNFMDVTRIYQMYKKDTN